MCAATLYSSNSGSYNRPKMSFSLFKSNEEANNSNLCKVELQRVVRAQANVEPCLNKVR